MGGRLRTESVIEVCGAPISKAHTFAEEARSGQPEAGCAPRVIVDPFGFDSHLLRFPMATFDVGSSVVTVMLVINVATQKPSNVQRGDAQKSQICS